jgi:hypothetical protein
VVWAADPGPESVARLLRDGIAQPLHHDLAADEVLAKDALYLDGSNRRATAEELMLTLADRRPALVVTTSDGMIESLHDPGQGAGRLGLPVDGEGHPVRPDELLERWEPNGAIWYAHACYSAGYNPKSEYTGLVDANSIIGQILEGAGGDRPVVATLPKALLGAPRPLRAFVGCIEPTFNWPLEQPEIGPRITETIRTALYPRLYDSPVGLAFTDCYNYSGELVTEWAMAVDKAVHTGVSTTEDALILKMSAHLLQSIVILGDPTVALPRALL